MQTSSGICSRFRIKLWATNRIKSQLFVYLLFLALTYVNVEAATIRVPQDFPSIRVATFAAVNGDTILVAPGTYLDNINFQGKAITVQSEQGPDVTIIDGRKFDSVVRFVSGEGRTSVLKGFTIRNGRAESGHGGGIEIVSSSPQILDNRIIDNQACGGVGISSSFGSPLIQGNVIAGNVQFGCSGGIGGGGISIGGDSSAEILDNVIANNVMTSADGGGISLFAAGRPVIKGNIISENEVSGLTPCTEGGGISVANFAQATIVNNLIIKNRAGCGGGVHWGASIGSTLVLVNNTIADNDALKGSGIFTNAFDSGLSQYFNNNIIAKAAQTALHCEGTGPSVMKSNNLYAPSGTAYFGCFDQTGTNGNISVDPLFVDPPNDNYLLHIGSPAIDSGDNTAPSLPAIDLDGYARIFDGDGVGGAVIDIGALEFSNRPPTANAGPDQTVAITTNCLATFTLDARASSDLNGDQLSFNWTGPFGIAPGPTPTVSLPKGTHVITLTVDDGNGGITQDTVTISVTDNTVPTIGSVAATPNVLRQANHQMVPVSINPAVFDCDSQVVCRIISVASNEPVEGLGDGDKTPDWVITGNLIVSLRAERSGKGNGRVYTITIECTDSSGNSSTKTVAVNVPRN